MPDSPLVSAAAVAVIALAIAVVIAVGLKVLRSFRDLGTDAERATYKTLHAASRAGQHLRTGLNPAGAGKASRQLRGLLGCDGFASARATTRRPWPGTACWPKDSAGRMEGNAAVLAGGHTAVIPAGELRAPGGRSPAGSPGAGYAAVIAPIRVGSGVAGVVAAFAPEAGSGLVRATGEVADWVATQVELAELDASRTLLMEAAGPAHAGQIGPHAATAR